MEKIFFSEPRLLWLVPFILIISLVYFRRTKKRLLLLSRMVILSLLVVAIANPYVVVTHTEEASRPMITVIADDTSSMDLFDKETARRIQADLPDSEIRFFSGDSTPLGDKILQYARQGETLLLVSDGYSNRGRDLDLSLGLAGSTNTTVFAVELSPLQMDASVEIKGENTAVLGGEYPFTLIVRSSGGRLDYKLNVYADERLIYADQVVSEERVSSIRMSHTFYSTKSHILRATITPVGDIRRMNNEYTKVIYVVPKPPVLLVSDYSSPLKTVLLDLYDLTTAAELPTDYKKYKAVVLDDQRYMTDLDSLVDYVREGGGLVVVGGPNSYDLGGYLDSPMEEVLPVRSNPSIFEGGKTVVLVLDISGSTQQKKMADGSPYLDYEKSLALEILRSPEFRDDLIGVVVFGTDAYVVSGPLKFDRRHALLEDKITKLWPSGVEETHLDDGLLLAWDMLNGSTQEGELIVISDGVITDDVFSNSEEIIQKMNVTTHLIQVQAFADAPGRLRSLAAKVGADYQPAIYPSSVTVKTLETGLEEEHEEPILEDVFALSIMNSNHYITTDLQLNATITGFNDATPRPGSQRLVTMADGKPILTTRRYGLGRVASLTTDSGNLWAPAIYTEENSMLISATVNWAVGDPRPKAGRIDAADGWQGTPLEIILVSTSPPKIESDQNIRLERLSEERYRTTLTPDEVGIYYFGDYGVSVNYPFEWRDVGLNPDLSRLIMAHGGSIFTEDEVKRGLVEEARRKSEFIVQERLSRRGILLFIALTIFLLEVIRRRLKEIK